MLKLRLFSKFIFLVVCYSFPHYGPQKSPCLGKCSCDTLSESMQTVGALLPAALPVNMLSPAMTRLCT